MHYTILFVDDEPHVTNALRRSLRKTPYEIMIANSAKEALEILNEIIVDVVVSDEKMPNMSGSEFLSIVRRDHPDTIRMMLTGHATLDAAIKAINEGEIYRLLTKPCNEVDLIFTIQQALQQKYLMAKARELMQAIKNQHEIIEEVKRTYPGITEVHRDDSDSIVVEDTIYDIDQLMKNVFTWNPSD